MGAQALRTTPKQYLPLADQPLIDGTVAAMKENGTTVRSLVKAIVASDAFAAK